MKKLVALAAILGIAALATWYYLQYAAPTRIATLNFPDFTVEKMVRSNTNPWVRIEQVDLSKVNKIRRYSMVLVRVHGSSMDASHLQAIKKAIAKGVPVFATESNNKEINSLHGRELDYISTLMANGSGQNYRSLFNYVRRKIDGKRHFNGDYHEPMLLPRNYFFHLSDDQVFSTFEAYQQFYEQSGRYKPGQPRVALLSGNINLQNSNEEHIAALIEGLEAQGLNVYPIHNLGPERLKMVADVRPNLIINRPHGRFAMGGNAEQLLTRLNAPLLSPITVSQRYETWLQSPQGMSGGGLTTMSVVLPELDGGIVPMPVAAQFERNGRLIFDAIPQQTDKFCRLAARFAALQTKLNDQKRVAIYYYKGTGKGSVGAADIEGVQSLYNTLVLLRQHGYRVDGLPANAHTLESMIQQSGSVLGAYALGAYDDFLRHGNPALVGVDTFYRWAQAELPQPLIEAMQQRYGPAPGRYMNTEHNGNPAIAVARIELGNVVLLPQPMPAEGENIDRLIHGTEGAPAYPYVASYMWTRRAFKADAIVHFGTHGSLEFVPGKQLALSNHDWTDALIGDVPHFYLYTISDVGEGIIAKRRSYATLVSHSTSAFMQGELYGDLQQLEHLMDKYLSLEDGALRQGYRQSVAQLAQRLNILSALEIDTTLKTLSDNDMQRIHMYLEEVNDAKVIDGLYTLGQPYTAQQVATTARLMAIEPMRYALASLDVARQKQPQSLLANPTAIKQHYAAKADQLIAQLHSGTNPQTLFQRSISPSESQLLAERNAQMTNAAKQRAERMRMVMAAAQRKPAQQPFLDAEGNLIELAHTDSTHRPAKSAEATNMAMMAAATAPTEPDETPLLQALDALLQAMQHAAMAKANLASTTKAEQDGLLNALAGGYVQPSTAGDPVLNPNAVPTGRNFYAINPETTPTPEAWRVGKRLADNLLEAELQSKGEYPQKVSFSLWASDFIASEGATVAQILYLLGVEPLRDGFGNVRSLQLIPKEQLGRPRIDVVVQTSGQLRDIAASRLALIGQAVTMAATASETDNYVQKGITDAEQCLLRKGFSPADARRYAKERVFGGANGNYGTGIMGLVQRGQAWDSTAQIAEQYLSSMSTMYSANGEEGWGESRLGVFEAALLNTSVVVHPRSSNTWGPLSLDHVYEFMGGISAAIQHVTGNDPTGYFNDFRNPSRARIQGLKEAIGVEASSTVLNPKFIGQMLQGEASSMAYFAEVFQNTFGWSATKPSAIDQHLWNSYFDVYVNDTHRLNLQQAFEQKNPYALQGMSAVLLEAARKGMWQANAEQLQRVANLHSQLVRDHQAACSELVCDNPKLRNYIAQMLSSQAAQQYEAQIKAAREVQLDAAEASKSVVLKKDTNTPEQPQQQAAQPKSTEQSGSHSLLLTMAAIALLIGVWLILTRKRQ